MDSKELWEELIGNDVIKKNFFILNVPLDLFGEAIKCYNAEAYLACSICTRSSIESILHIAKTRNHVAHRSAIVNLDRSKWSELMKWTRQHGLLDQELENRVNKSRQLGNLGAHLAQRIDQAHQDLGENETFEIPLWVTPEEAWDSIVTCKDLILHMTAQRWK